MTLFLSFPDPHADSGYVTQSGEEKRWLNILYLIKKHGRTGSTYFVDPSHRVCEFDYELSGVDAYDILITPPGPREWFLPVREILSESDKAEIIAKLKKWLTGLETDLEIRAFLY